MKKETIQDICNAWEMFYDDEISIPMLLEIVRSAVGLLDISDVITGLVKGGILIEVTNNNDR